MSVVLDASAVLAVVYFETGADVVLEALPGAVISSVNLSEVIAKLADGGTPESEIFALLRELKLTVIPFGIDQAYLAGMLRPLTRSAGLSLGDRACIALGLQLGYGVLTADRGWAALDLGIEVRPAR